jgi:hypothetical protein
VLRETAYYARMAFYFGQFVRLVPITDPRALIAETLRRRDEHFLDLVRTGVYGNPNSPLYELLATADCGFDDLASLVRTRGIEHALERLYDAGVYFSHAEVKGAPIVRHGRTIANAVGATRHPRSGGGIESISSGSRSAGTTTPGSNAYRRYREAYESILLAEIGAEDSIAATLHSILPAPSGLIFCAGEARRGRPVKRWFAGGGSRRAAPYRVMTRALVAESRLLGCQIPQPTLLADDDFLPVVEWIAGTRRDGRGVLIRANASTATRVCAAARDSGRDISGTVFVTSGEPVSDAKRALLSEVGARCYPRYVISELGTVGLACSQTRGNSVHWLCDSTALIARRRMASFADAEVNSLLFTTINPHATRLLINAEMEDHAWLARATHDCEFCRLGFTTILEDVHSFGKLTGHGLTLAGSDMIALLEERLPRAFGGAPGDYQLVECEGDRQSEVHLRVSPRVAPPDLSPLRTYLLREVRAMYGGALSERTWVQTSSLKVVAAEPFRTRNGKIHPLHLISLTERTRA